MANIHKRQFRIYKKGARIRNIEFDLSYEDFSELSKENCFYCGSAPSLKKISRGLNKVPVSGVCNGVDRKNNLKGYSKINCVPCCSICNAAKSDLSFEAFILWLDKISRFQQEFEIEIL